MTMPAGPNQVTDRELLAANRQTDTRSGSEPLGALAVSSIRGCPICNLHLRSIVQRHDDIAAAGIREVVFFHSSADELRKYTAELPFATIADPEKRYYREFGVESSRRALLHPRTWGAVIRGTALTALGRFQAPALKQDGGHLGLPADLLIDPRGRVLAAKYGEHAYDQWSVDELLELARAVSSR